MTRGSAQNGVGIRVKVSSIPVVGSAWAQDSMLGPTLKAGGTRTRTSESACGCGSGSARDRER
ncbi:hypothetical protein TIFTF001_053204 [Ficus carica]|uniref:Uncharacterized protein n=1 Tax=Ficus carica TaxID=3494 RepID=A0AA88JHM0_FICCA|nr:hypothetical protein TIFTF001_053204 [Ficus carica]